jgi:hypothetical protein
MPGGASGGARNTPTGGKGVAVGVNVAVGVVVGVIVGVRVSVGEKIGISPPHPTNKTAAANPMAIIKVLIILAGNLILRFSGPSKSIEP